MRSRTKKTLSFSKKLLTAVLAAVFAALFLTVVLNLAVCFSTKARIYSPEDSPGPGGCECIIVLGCGIRDQEPTPMLADRLDTAIALYKAGAAPKLLMSGDNGRDDHDEVSVMREYALAGDIPSEDILTDGAGYSTYETMYRAGRVFGIKKAVVVTQKYHLYRALYDAAAFGIDAVGVAADGSVYASQIIWDTRECLARVKDYFWCLIRPEPSA